MRSHAIKICLGMLVLCSTIEARAQEKIHELKASPILPKSLYLAKLRNFMARVLRR